MDGRVNVTTKSMLTNAQKYVTHASSGLLSSCRAIGHVATSEHVLHAAVNNKGVSQCANDGPRSGRCGAPSTGAVLTHAGLGLPEDIVRVSRS